MSETNSTTLRTRIVHKHDLESNWLKATNFVPLKGELIIYDTEVDKDGNILQAAYSTINPDGTEVLPNGRQAPITYVRQKIGDGIHSVSDLPFSSPEIHNDEALLSLKSGFNSKAGSKAFTITGINKQISAYALDSSEGLEVGDTYSIHLAHAKADGTTGSAQGDLVGKITQVGSDYNNIKFRVPMRPDSQYGAYNYGNISVEYGMSTVSIGNYGEYGGHGIAEIVSGDPLKGEELVIKITGTYTDLSYEDPTYEWPYEEQFTLTYFGSDPSDSRVGDLDWWTDGLVAGYVCYLEVDPAVVLVDTFFDVPAGAAFRTSDSYLDENGIDSEVNTFRIPAKPDAGTRQIGALTFAAGYESQALSKGARAEGASTIAHGSWSHTEGYGTKAAYSAHAEGKGNTADGQQSHAEGFYTTASGDQAHSEGHRTEASGEGSHAEGSLTKSIGKHSHTEGLKTRVEADSTGGGHAEGAETVVKGYAAHAEGNKSKAIGSQSHAEGYSTQSEGSASHTEGISTSTATNAEGAHAEGKSSKAANAAAHAEGTSTTASGNSAHSEGINTNAVGISAHAEGWSDASSTSSFASTEALINTWTANPTFTRAQGQGSHAEGNNTLAVGNFSHTEGCKTLAQGAQSHAEGWKSSAVAGAAHAEGVMAQATHEAAHAEGNSTIASGSAAHAEGKKGVASGEGAHVEGLSSNTNNTNYDTLEDLVVAWETGEKVFTRAAGLGAHAEGNNTLATGDYAHAEGCKTLASGLQAHAEGWGTKATGKGSHAEGNGTEATASFAHAEGFGTKATGNNAHAEGSETTAEGLWSHSEGKGTLAHGTVAHAEGESTQANGNSSHAGGIGTKADGACSFAHGTYTVASKNDSVAFGERTVTNKKSQFVVGKYNNADAAPDALFAVGNGISGTRSNAFYVNEDGTAYLDNDKKVATEDWALQNTVGQFTEAGGEIFNDYLNNLAGAKAFTITDIKPETNMYILDSTEGLEEGDVYTVHLQYQKGSILESQQAELCGTITSVSRAFPTYFHGNFYGLFYMVESDREPYWSTESGQDIEAIDETYCKITDWSSGNYIIVPYVWEQQSTTSSKVTIQLEDTTSFYNQAGELVEGNYWDYSYSIGTLTSIELILVAGEQTSQETLMYESWKIVTSLTYEPQLGKVVVDEFFNIPSGTTFATSESYIDENGFDSERNTFRIIAKPDIGTRSIGQLTRASGYNTKALSMGANASGSGTIAYGAWSHTEGRNTEAAYSSHAEGSGTKARGQNSHSEGNNTWALGMNSHVEGENTVVSGKNAHAEGLSAVLNATEYTKEQLIAEWSKGTSAPTFTRAFGIASHAEGNNALAVGNNSHSEGTKTLADGDQAHSEGWRTRAAASCAHAEGNQTVALGDQSHAEGTLTSAEGQSSHAEGNGTTAQGIQSHTEGWNTYAGGNAAHAEGISAVNNKSVYASDQALISSWQTSGYKFTRAHGQGSHAEGNNTLAVGNYSHTEGCQTLAAGSQAHTEGYRAFAYGSASHAEGVNTYAAEEASHAEGQRSLAAGRASHAEGLGSVVNNNLFSTAEDTISAWSVNKDFHRAYGLASHVEGYNNLATGDYSHAQGETSIASGKASFVSGVSCEAQGNSSSAFGWLTIATKANSFVVGHCNDTEAYPNALFVVGGGSRDVRKNLFVVNNDGNIFAGSDGKKQLATQEWVESKLNELATLINAINNGGIE